VISDPLKTEVSQIAERQERLSQPLIDEEVASALSWTLPSFVRADALAIHYQARYNVLSATIHFLAALAVAAVAFEVAFARPHTAWLSLEIFFLLLLVIAVYLGRRGRWRERWMGNRALAEALRSAQFIVLTGTSERDDADHGMSAVTEDAWFQRAFAELWKARPRLTLHESQAPALRAFVLEGWIEDQIAFHKKTAQRHLARRNLYTRIVYVLAGITIVVAALHIAELPAGGGWSDVFTFVAITLPGFGAAVTGMREGGQHRLHEERSRTTVKRLKKLTGAPDLKPDLASVRTLVVDAHRVIVEESVGWSTVVEFHDLDILI
jgi:hypothetical protein